MSEPRRRSLILTLFCLAIAACTAQAPGAPGSLGVSPPITAASASAAASAAPSDPPVAPDGSALALVHAWATAPLTDVASGEVFRIADLAGSVVIIETMAIWCPNCRTQQMDVQAALARLPADRVQFVVLDVDPNEDASSLAEYQQAHGFDGRYAIAGRDVARALAADFGDQLLNPPSTPILIVGTDGTVTLTDFGHKTADEIVALAEANGV